MKTQSRLARVLGRAHHNPTHHATLAEFASHHDEDEQFLDTARGEHKRLMALDRTLGCPLSQRCYASSQSLKFLTAAIGHVETKERDTMPSKIKNLASLARDAVNHVEAEAERAAMRLSKAKDKAAGGIAKLDSISQEVENSAAELHDFANQVTNGGPPLDDTGK